MLLVFVFLFAPQIRRFSPSFFKEHASQHGLRERVVQPQGPQAQRRWRRGQSVSGRGTRGTGERSSGRIMSSCCCTRSSLQSGPLRARGSRGRMSRRAGAGARARASQLCAPFEVQKSCSRRLQRVGVDKQHCPLLLAFCCPLVLSCLVSRGQLKGRQFETTLEYGVGMCIMRRPLVCSRFAFCRAFPGWGPGVVGGACHVGCLQNALMQCSCSVCCSVVGSSPCMEQWQVSVDAVQSVVPHSSRKRQWQSLLM